MQIERPRARRYPFVTSIEITDMQSETQTKEQTKDLSLFGCHVNTLKPLAMGAKVRIRIAHKSTIFTALGRVANVQPNAHMGIVFTSIAPHDQQILEQWLAELRDHREPPAKDL